MYEEDPHCPVIKKATNFLLPLISRYVMQGEPDSPVQHTSQPDPIKPPEEIMNEIRIFLTVDQWRALEVIFPDWSSRYFTLTENRIIQPLSSHRTAMNKNRSIRSPLTNPSAGQKWTFAQSGPVRFALNVVNHSNGCPDTIATTSNVSPHVPSRGNAHIAAHRMVSMRTAERLFDRWWGQLSVH